MCMYQPDKNFIPLLFLKTLILFVNIVSKGLLRILMLILIHKYITSFVWFLYCYFFFIEYITIKYSAFDLFNSLSTYYISSVWFIYYIYSCWYFKISVYSLCKKIDDVTKVVLMRPTGQQERKKEKIKYTRRRKRKNGVDEYVRVYKYVFYKKGR